MPSAMQIKGLRRNSWCYEKRQLVS